MRTSPGPLFAAAHIVQAARKHSSILTAPLYSLLLAPFCSIADVYRDVKRVHPLFIHVGGRSFAPLFHLISVLY